MRKSFKMSSSSTLDSLVSDWLRWSESGSLDREAVMELVRAGDSGREELWKIMGKRVAFGTAGIRAKMGPG